MVVGCAWVVDCVWEASQFDGLGNGTDGCLDATGLDLLPSSKTPTWTCLAKAWMTKICLEHPGSEGAD